VPFLDAFRELRDDALRAVLPLRDGALPQHGGERLVAAEVACREQRSSRVEILTCELECLIDGAHRVSELHALVPDRVPELRRELLARRRIGGEEQDVEVALRAELAASVSTDRHERDATRAGGHLGPQFADPRVDPVAVAAAPRRTVEHRVGEEIVSVHRSGHR
jgi:hypothetical protein